MLDDFKKLTNDFVYAIAAIKRKFTVIFASIRRVDKLEPSSHRKVKNREDGSSFIMRSSVIPYGR